MSKEKWLESLEAVLVFVVPLLFTIPFYALGFLTEVAGHYITYSVYIAASVLLTKYNGRKLAKIGLTHKQLIASLGYAVVPVAAALLRNVFFASLEISPEANSWASVAYALFYWMFGGLGQEVIFRGLILSSFQRWKGWKIALVASSLLFGLMHVRQGVTGVIGTTIIGVYWGWVAIKTRNIIGTSLAHGFYNFIFNFLFIF